MWAASAWPNIRFLPLNWPLLGLTLYARHENRHATARRFGAAGQPVGNGRPQQAVLRLRLKQKLGGFSRRVTASNVKKSLIRARRRIAERCVQSLSSRMAESIFSWRNTPQERLRFRSPRRGLLIGASSANGHFSDKKPVDGPFVAAGLFGLRPVPSESNNSLMPSPRHPAVRNWVVWKTRYVTTITGWRWTKRVSCGSRVQ